MKFAKSLMAAATMILLLSQCNKSGSSSDSTMRFQLKATNPSIVVNRPEAGSIVWTSGTVSATQVKFEAKKNNSAIEFKSFASQQIDLFASVLANFGNITIPSGSYTEVEFIIQMEPSGSVAAMELNGLYTNGTGTTTPVLFSLNSLFELKAEQTNVVVNDNTSITALTTLDLSFISNGITQALMNSATITNGKIVISASSNTNIYNIIINNLQQFHHIDVSHH